MPATTKQSRKRKLQLPTDGAVQEHRPRQSPMYETAMARATSTHIFFWKGLLSNWHVGPQIPGSRILALLLPELEKLGVSHPRVDAFSTRLLGDHMFNCGEQWMMVMKGWLFERGLELAESIVGGGTVDAVDEKVEDVRADEQVMTGVVYEKFKSMMYLMKLPKEFAEESKERAMWQSTICQVLRNKNPRQQKALGRKAKGFNDEVWSAVNMACVTAACVARAEVDPLLREMYLSSGTREYVEGSPMDKVWGVGLHWEALEIDNPSSWRGENRLGKCHDVAARKIREMFSEEAAGFEEKGGQEEL